MRPVGLTGKMSAGKDHTFRQLEHRAPGLLHRLSFADLLRLEIEHVLKADLPVLWEKPYSEEVRRLLQYWGTDFRRADDPDYWVRLGKLAMMAELAWGNIPVFSDVRFPNEADMIREQGGLIVRVVAEPRERKIRLGMEPPSHASEVAMDNYDVDYEIESSESNPFYHTGLDLIVEAMR